MNECVLLVRQAIQRCSDKRLFVVSVASSISFGIVVNDSFGISYTSHISRSNAIDARGMLKYASVKRSESSGNVNSSSSRS